MPCWKNQHWPHNLNQMASGKPGAVQFKILAERFGSFFEIHSDFYDWEPGQHEGSSIQPKFDDIDLVD